MLVATALRFYHLGHQSLWVDEIFTWRAAAPFAPLPLSDLLADLHGPLVSGIIHVWISIFGDSEFALRVPLSLASIALVPAVAHLARRAAGERAFLPAAWLVALSPFAVWYGQELRNYAFGMLWAALALLATLSYRATGRARHLAWLVLWTVLGAWSNLNALLLLPANLALLVASPPPGRGRWVPPLATALGVAVILSPWMLHYLGVLELHRLVPGREALPMEEPLRGASTFSWPAIPFTFYVFSVGYTLGPSLRELHADSSLHALVPHLSVVLPAALLFGGLAVGGVLALRRRPFALAALLLSIAVPLAFVTYFAVMNFKTFNPRYVSVGWPAWIVLMAAGFAAWPRPARLAAGILGAGLCALSLVHHYGDPEYAKEDFRSACRDLAARIAPGDSLVAAGNHSPMDYYWRDRLPHHRVYWLGYARDERMATTFERDRNRSGGATWVVVSRPQDLDPGGRFERWLVATYRPVVWSYPGVRIYRLPPASGP